MSQACKIYELLARTDNRAADRALLQAFRRAQAPYDTVLFETILERGQARSTGELIDLYDSLEPDWRALMINRVGDLYSGLRRVVADGDAQARLNALEIIAQGRCYRLSDLAVILLRDPERHVGRRAAGVLLGLARRLGADGPGCKEPFESPGAVGAQGGKTDRQYLLASLQQAVLQYGRGHHQRDVVLAAMHVASAQWDEFWRDCLDSFHTVKHAVRQYLIDRRDPGLAHFFLSALARPSLRALASRAIAGRCKSDFVLGLARALRDDSNEQIVRGLGRVCNPLWLDPELLPLAEFAPSDQLALVLLVKAVPGDDACVAEYLAAFADQMPFEVAHEALDMVGGLGEAAAGPLERMLASPHEALALGALRQLIERQAPNLRGIMVRQLAAPHPRVREVARRYIQDTVFVCYWETFDRLSRGQQMAAGKAVFKIDPYALDRWHRRVDSPETTHRFRAVRIARLLDKASECSEKMMKLTRDPDGMVRSCAVAALGDPSCPRSTRIKECLLGALKDQDGRVRANAIEALEGYESEETASRVAPFVQSVNSRVRANAIKALFARKAHAARRALDAMLADARQSHRRSADWLVQNLTCTKLDTPEETAQLSHAY